MQKMFTAVLAIAFSVVMTVLVAAAPVAAAEPPSALSCYGNAKGYSTTTSTANYPSSGWLRTTSSCTDINLTSGMNRNVRVCFHGGSCNSWKTVTSQWTVIATNVLDNTRFYFQFASPQNSGGLYAI